MRYLVTGGTGFIGSNIALALRDEGHHVFITARSNEQIITGVHSLDPQTIDWEKIGTLDALFHQGAIADTTVMDRERMFESNVTFSDNLFRDAIAHGCKHIVYASSTAIYGDAPAPYQEGITPFKPLNPYAESKVRLEQLAEKYSQENPDTSLVGLRYCNVYGPRENHKGKMANQIYQLAQQMVKGNPRIFKFGEQKRDHIFVKDVVSANLLASKSTRNFVVNCGYGKAVTFNHLIELLNTALGTNRVPEYIDNPHEGKYQNYTECDMTRASELLGFVPKYNPERGIEEYYKSGFLVQKS